MPHLFLTRRVSQLLGLALMSWAFASIGVHHPSLRLPYLVFSIRSYLSLDFNRASSLRPTYRHPFLPCLTIYHLVTLLTLMQLHKAGSVCKSKTIAAINFF